MINKEAQIEIYLPRGGRGSSVGFSLEWLAHDGPVSDPLLLARMLIKNIPYYSTGGAVSGRFRIHKLHALPAPVFNLGFVYDVNENEMLVGQI